MDKENTHVMDKKDTLLMDKKGMMCLVLFETAL